MTFPENKTKIVCTIGPASNRLDVLEQMLHAGMDVARLNFSHGDFNSHAQVIENIRLAARNTGKRVAIMADLPGPKLRIGQLAEEPLELKDGDRFTLTTESITGNHERVSVDFAGLTQAVHAGDTLFINDGFIQLCVEEIAVSEVCCRVVVGGELRSRKGLNLPGIKLGISAFTEQDHACLKFALEHGVDACSQSFVSTADDIKAVRNAAAELGYYPFVIAKIERAEALENVDKILAEADGIMVARGDLGVEIPIEKIAVVQKHLMEKANLVGKPVITATHMLESMVEHRRPTRAEVTDVANAILDGTDCVMLSGESAMGKYPVAAVAMLAKVAAATEPGRPRHRTRETMRSGNNDYELKVVDLIALNVQYTLERVQPAAVIIPTRTGATARNVTRFRLRDWITAFSPNETCCQALQFSYGVQPVRVDQEYADWSAFTRDWLREQGISSGLVLLTQGPSENHPAGNHRLEIMQLDKVP